MHSGAALHLISDFIIFLIVHDGSTSLFYYFDDVRMLKEAVGYHEICKAKPCEFICYSTAKGSGSSPESSVNSLVAYAAVRLAFADQLRDSLIIC